MIGSRAAYALCMVLATFVAAMLIRRRQQNLPITKSQKIGVAIGALIGATFAAKLPFILGANPADGLLAAWLSDGKTVLWALVGGYLGVELAKWSLHVSVSTGDSFVVPVALAIAIGRIGCFLYGCCYGIETDQSWGVRFWHAPDQATVLRHPTQLYEFVFHVGFALIAWLAISRPPLSHSTSSHSTSSQSTSFQSEESHLLRRRRLMAGNWMPAYLVGYATFRFISEYWRPERRLAIGLTIYQCSAIAIAGGFLVLLVFRFQRCSRSGVTA